MSKVNQLQEVKDRTIQMFVNKKPEIIQSIKKDKINEFESLFEMMCLEIKQTDNYMKVISITAKYERLINKLKV